MSRRHASLLAELPARLAYPASRDVMLLFAGLCLLRLLANLPNLLGLLFELAFWVMAFKLAVEALENTAHGRYEALAGNELVATDGDAMEQVALGLVFALPVVLLGAWVGPAAAWTWLAVAVLFMPAAVMLLAINHNFWASLNPLAWLALAGRLGGEYVAAVVVFAALGLASTLVQALFESLLPAGTGLLPASFVALYALVASYHVLGDVLHRHHEALGLDIAPAVPRATYASPIEDEAMAQAEALAAQGQPAAAALRLADLFRGRGASAPVHERYRQLLIAAGDLPRLAEHDREYIASLVETGEEKRALAIAGDVLGRDPGFRLVLPAHVARLVALAARQGQGQLAVALARDFESRFPDAPETPEVVLAAAVLMDERLGQEDAAAGRLEALARRFPEHRLAAEARERVAAIRARQAGQGGRRPA